MADIEHKHGEKGGLFLARINDEVMGEMSYHLESDTIMAIEHTEVKTSARGNNVGMELLEAAVAYAGTNQIKIRPVCNFVNVIFNKYPDKYRDVNLK